MVKQNVIFIGGVHGVGKTTLCNNIANIFDINHYSSSELIAKYNADKVRKDKKVENVKSNQNILIKALKEYTNEKEMYLLDGHFCLINKRGIIEEVPKVTFKDINILHIILLVDDPGIILKRIQSRDSNSLYSSEFITNFQNCEINYAKYISNEINAKFDVIELNKDSNYVNTFKELVYRDLFK